MANVTMNLRAFTIKAYSLLLWRVFVTISGMKYAEIVHVLDVALAKIEAYCMLLCQEMQSIKCFGLCLRDGGNIY
jgi:hypothetical protein